MGRAREGSEEGDGGRGLGGWGDWGWGAGGRVFGSDSICI